MRQGGPNARRPRGRHNNGGGAGEGGNRQGSGSPMRGEQRPRSAASLRHQTFDSNGPDVRVRGNAWQVYEKYLSLARDATSSGDRVMAENYQQHAEHYYRITEAIEEATAAEQRQRGGGQPPAAYAGQQPEVPSNYYAPDGQLMASGGQPVPATGGQPAGMGVQPPTGPMPPVQPQPAQAEVVRKTPPAPPASPFFAQDDLEDHDSGPQTLVAQR